LLPSVQELVRRFLALGKRGGKKKLWSRKRKKKAETEVNGESDKEGGKWTQHV